MNTILKNRLIGAMLIFASVNSYAQDRSHFYTNLLNPFLINPAMAGSNENTIDAIFNGNTFVGGIESSPRTLNFGIHTQGANNTGWGAKIVSDWRGVFQTINTEAAYSKMIAIETDHTLTFGLSLGFIQTNIRSELLNEQVNMSDPTLVSPDLNKVRVASGAGMVYRYKKRAEVSFSSPMMVTGDEALNGFFIISTNYKFNVEQTKTYTLKPIINYYNFVYSPKMVDILLAADWKETVKIQAGYRSNGTVVTGLGFNFNKISFGYNFYSHTGDLNRLAPAQNEIVIALSFSKPQSKRSSTGQNLN